MKRYKLTSQNRTTHNGFQLPADGEWFEAEDMTSPPMECSNTVLHHYTHPLLAVLFNPIHGNYNNPRLFEIEIDEELGTDGLKAWCRRQRVIKEIPLSEITTDQRIEFAILCAMLTCKDQQWLSWADKWLSGEDRSHEAARAAAWEVAAEAARAAAWAAARAARAEAARAEVRAARAEAARAAAEARAARGDIDFISIIESVIKKG